jgi:hypothetical protein
MSFVEIVVLSAGICGGQLLAQQPTGRQSISTDAAATIPPAGPVDLEWTPPALAQLSAQAATKSSFTLDRALLGAAASLIPDSERETRQVVRKLDGLSVHLLRFGAAGIPDETEVEALRQTYHLRGWKHLVTTTSAGGPVQSGTTDAWMVLDGVTVRGGVVLVETPRSLTLVTVAGNLNPEDLLHLQGHFGIPRFEGDSFKAGRDKYGFHQEETREQVQQNK